MADKVEDAIQATEQEENKQDVDLVKVNKLLHEEVQELKQALSKLKDEQHKLILATKVNTLKEQEIRNDEFKKYANQKLIKETIVPLLLEFERALNFQTNDQVVKNFLTGFKHVFNNFQNLLKAEGLERITTEPGSLLNGQQDHPVTTIAIKEETTEQKDNMIAEVVLSGYKLHDRVIKPVDVKVYQLEDKLSNNNS